MPSMKPSRTHIAAAGTMVALGALTAVAIGAGGSEQPAKAVSAPKAQPVEVRTVTVHRTVHVVRHQKPKKQPAAAPPAAVPHTVQIAQVPAPTPVASTPAPASAAPLKTATSGGSGEHRDEGDEHERGDDHEGGDDD